MTITIAWIRRRNKTVELIVASDSRLRSEGAIDQAQKIFPLERGDCCLAFCGDAQIAYPLFVQAGTTLNNFIKTRTRAMDFNRVVGLLSQILDNLINSWDLAANDKARSLIDTRILFAGWSWESQKFIIGFFENGKSGFQFHHRRVKKMHPWCERHKSLVFIGDYEKDYIDELKTLMAERMQVNAQRSEVTEFDFDYEPVEALHRFIIKSKSNPNFAAIGGSPQLIKVYPFASTKIFVVRTETNSNFLLGRKMFSWEKTEYPIIDLTGAKATIIYPLKSIPKINDNKVDEDDDLDHAF